MAEIQGTSPVAWESEDGLSFRTADGATMTITRHWTAAERQRWLDAEIEGLIAVAVHQIRAARERGRDPDGPQGDVE